MLLPLNKPNMEVILHYKKFFPAIAFFAGFLWDSLTLTRIDRILDNVILLLYLILLGVLIILLNLLESGHKLKPIFTRFKKWYPLAIQFLIGGLFSAYVVFYFKSASFTKASLFFILLMVFLVANEFLEKRYSNIYYQVSLFFLVNFSFFIFVVPVILRYTGLLSFMIGGVLSVLTVESLVYFLEKKSVFPTRKSLTICRAIPPSFFGVMFLFYVFNWIPPVPLSLKSSGIYHTITKKTEQGALVYEVSYEKPPWYKPWKKSDDPFKYNDGDNVYCFTAVFASTDLNTSIYHHWKWYSEEEGAWESSDRIELDISGGRDLGYRLYTVKENIQPGKWRVDIETENGQIIGRVNFSIVQGDGKPFDLKTIIR